MIKQVSLLSVNEYFLFLLIFLFLFFLQAYMDIVQYTKRLTHRNG